MKKKVRFDYNDEMVVEATLNDDGTAILLMGKSLVDFLVNADQDTMNVIQAGIMGFMAPFKAHRKQVEVKVAEAMARFRSACDTQIVNTQETAGAEAKQSMRDGPAE